MRSKWGNNNLLSKMNKKGVSEIIAWVLLFGLSIILATLVGNWAIRQAREFQPEKTLALELYCDNVALIAECDANQLIVKNKGAYTFSSLLLRATDATGITANTDIKAIINPGSQSTLVCPASSATELEIIPKITRDAKEIVCGKKAYTLDSAALNLCCPV